MADVDARETLLGASAVYLYGRVVSDLLLVVPKPGQEEIPEDRARPSRTGANKFLQRQLRNNNAQIARIYYFVYEGGLFELARPTLLLVHGGGIPADSQPPADEKFRRLSRSPGRATRTGLARQIGSFATDMMLWVYDKGDFSMRLDTDTGTLEQILLSAESGDYAPNWSGGVMARSSGSLARSSGAMARSSGAMAPRSGDTD